MLTHFYLTVSGPKYEFQAEMFLRSLETWGRIPFVMTICGDVKSPFLRRHTLVTHNKKFNPNWYGGLCSVPIRGDVTVYADTDILVLGNLKPFVESDKATGVIAYQSPFSERTEWERLFDGCGVPLRSVDCTANYDGKKVPFYFNLGFVAVPTKYIKELNEAMEEYLVASEEVVPGHYHRPQFAMCLSLAALGIPCRAVPLRWNCPDLYGDIPGTEDPAVIHLLRTKSKIENIRDLRSPDLPDSHIVNLGLSRMRRLAKGLI